MDLEGLLVCRVWRVGSGCSGGGGEVWGKRGEERTIRAWQRRQTWLRREDSEKAVPV
jgi:hypothetical protein